MNTSYQRLTVACGLTADDAARLHRVPVATVRMWSRDWLLAPPWAVSQLSKLQQQIERAAERTVAELEQQAGDNDMIELVIARDDTEAKSLGLPCVGSHAALVRLIADKLKRPVKMTVSGATSVGTNEGHKNLSPDSSSA